MADTPTTGAVAFLCAMPMEAQPLRRRLGLRRTAVDGLDLLTGRVGGRDAVAVVSGMGTALAGEATERLLAAVPVERLVVAGISGAVDDTTPIGTLVVPDVVIDDGSGAEHRPAPLEGHTARGALYTTDRLITDAATLAGLRARGVVALDMETAAVASVCERHGVPWTVVRAISDRATDGSVDEAVFRLSHQDGSPNPRAIARYVVTHPTRLPGLARLAKGSRLAAARAAAAAADAVA